MARFDVSEWVDLARKLSATCDVINHCIQLLTSPPPRGCSAK